MGKYLLIAVFLSASNFSGLAQTLSQTRTATAANNFQGVYVDNYVRINAGQFAANDGIYAYTKKLSTNGISYASLALQGFGFTIPDDAMIQNITVTVRRFKNGKASIKDYFVSVMQSYSGNSTNGVSMYGVMWRNGDVYPGNIYPDVEAQYDFIQNASGNNGGYDHNQGYQWTPAMVNHPYFGVRIDVYPPSGPGSVVVYYDYVQIKVEYAIPAPITQRSGETTEANILRQPIVYPNPFTTKVNIHFTAAEAGKAVVELFDIKGVKVRSLFSGSVIKGQVYTIVVGDAQLPKGTYVYMIRNGERRHTGRIIKE